MILLRKKRPSNLYYISPLSNLSGKFIDPSVPNNFLTNNKVGDYKTKRVCFYPTIDEALIALSQELTNKELYVYKARNICRDSLYKPDISEVPNCMLTNEYWYLDKAELYYLGKLRVIGPKKVYYYHYGPRSTKKELKSWKWEEVLDNKWDKKKLIENKMKNDN